MIVTGVRDDSYREILGAKIANSEDDFFWSGLFQDLADRGLSGVKLVISDGRQGIQKAVEKSLTGHRPCAECQRERYRLFRETWAAANPDLVDTPSAGADQMDNVLHAERLGAAAGSRLIPPPCPSCQPACWWRTPRVSHGW